MGWFLLLSNRLPGWELSILTDPPGYITAHLTTIDSAEGTLVGSDESDSGESVAVSSKHGSVSEEDSNIVYNRICGALESLISEAQTALDRSTNNPSPSPQPVERRPSAHPRRLRASQGQRQRLLQLPNVSTIDLSSTPTDDGESSQVDACSQSSCRTSRRSSIIPTRTDRSLSVSSAATSLASSSQLQVPTRRSTYSKMMWREKQLEQYERFKRSSDRISLELKMLLDDTIMDQLELQEAYMSSSSPSSPPRTHSSSPSTSSSSRARPSDVPPSPSRQSSENVGTSSHSGRRRGTGSKAERMQRSYQLQTLNPQVRPRQQLHRRRPGSSHDFSSSMYSHHHSSSQSSATHRATSSSSLRQFKSQGVGASHPQSIILQLYRLWKQTWLRKRIMHVLTESLEVMLILWVIMRLSEASLAWMGIQMSKSGPRAWLAYIYGDREGAGAAAKELYEKIRRDGLRLQQYQFRQQQERETLMQEFSASEAASGIPRTPFSPKGMVLAPARRLLEHAVSGVVLAYLSDAARRLARTL